MPDSFQCPQCGASYARERRRIGKAVVCACGNKFLVPPPESETPTSDERRPPVAPDVAQRVRSVPPRPRVQPPPSGDSSAEVLPMAEVIEPAAPSAPGRWAEPIEPQQAEPLPQAEIVYEAHADTGPLPPANDLFAPGGAYGDPLVATTYGAPLATPPPPARAPKKRAKKRRSTSDGGQVGFTHWVAYLVLFLLLPAAAIFTVLGLVEYRRGGPGVGPPRGAVNRPSQPFSQPGGAAASTANEPAASGLPITVWNAVKKGDDFSLEYRVDRGPLNRSSQYFWVVSASQGKIEFPVPVAAFQARGKLSGKTTASANLTPPYTAHIEEQTGATRTRVSNDAPVTVGG